MSYGLQVFNTLGATVVGGDDVLARQIDEFVVAAGAGEVRNYTGQVEGTMFVASVPEATYFGALPNPHGVSVSGLVVNVFAHPTALPGFAGRSTDSRIMVFVR